MLSVIVDSDNKIVNYTYVPYGYSEELEPLPDGLREIKSDNDLLGELLLANEGKKAVAVLDSNGQLVGIDFEEV